ncbi:MerR family transcriptional regulator [Micromonospora sp. URMC 103]|uniref:MerR family transcriptional regulator n=1 Tax=Micromonospora sp. URMC 103 TaxID=3423406 RepID=UPI003F1BCA7E
MATHVLRHWEDVGLLSPARRVAGRRVYGSAHVTRLAEILLAKEAGFRWSSCGSCLTLRIESDGGICFAASWRRCRSA